MASNWRILKRAASLHAEVLKTQRYSARVDLRAPEQGIAMHCSGADEEMSSDCTLLALQNTPGEHRWKLQNYYARGRDLVAFYPGSTGQKIETRVYWRFLSADNPGRSVGIPAVFPVWGFDLIVSVQTDLLHDAPRLTVGSRLSAAEVWQVPASGEASELTQKNRSSDSSLSPGAVVLRPPAGRFSYVEFTHPAAVLQSRITLQDQTCRTQHLLLEDVMEKGVIRQVCVRGLWLPRQDDLEAAQKHYEHWLTSEPPLTV